jgi:hypothetical protein
MTTVKTNRRDRRVKRRYCKGIAERMYGERRETYVRGRRIVYRYKGDNAPVAAWLESEPKSGVGKGVIFNTWELFNQWVVGNGGVDGAHVESATTKPH